MRSDWGSLFEINVAFQREWGVNGSYRIGGRFPVTDRHDECFSGPGYIPNLNRFEENDMNVMGIVTDLIAGGVGGNIAGAVLKRFDLGPVGNTVAGMVGGVGGGQLLSMLISGGAAATTAASTGGMDMSSIVSNLAGGGIGGVIVMAIVGMIKTQMAKNT
ncbi:MAG TPA: hypothetical protein VK627_09130 [Edaphobacter sp.]|nr:hypothetical protein [Edaphobacter sp.]